MLNIRKTIRDKLTLLLLLVFLCSCGSPSDNEIKSLVKLPYECIKPIEFNEVTVGDKQTVEAEEFGGTAARVEWYPVRVTFTAKCIPINSSDPGIPAEIIFEDSDNEAVDKWRSEQKEKIDKEGVETTFTKHYRFSKNEYGEWTANERSR